MSIPRVPAVASRLCAAFILAAFLMLIMNCSREERSIGAIKKHFEDEDYREAIFLCARALESGAESGEIRRYYGLSLLARGRDFEAFPQLERAASLDSRLAPVLSERLFESGKFDYREGRTARASSRLMEAVKLDPSLGVGRFSYLIADEYYRIRNYEQAARYYEEALSVQADTSIAAPSMMRMAEAYTRLDSLDLAEEVYEEIARRFPRGEYADDAAWNLANLLLGKARKQLALARFEEAFAAAEAAAEITNNATLAQNALFLMGEACEGLSDYDAALEHYKAIVRSGHGAPGGVVQKARGKIDAYRRAGLYE